MKNRNEIKEHKEDMTIEEYRKELHRIFENMEDIQLLRHFYIYALNRTNRIQTVDSGTSSDYGDMIVEMVEQIESRKMLIKIYIFIKTLLEE